MKKIAVFVISLLLLAGCLSTEQQVVLDRLNEDRVENSKPGLSTTDALNNKAQAWAEKMADDGYISHSNISAGLPSCWSKLGENVGYGPNVGTIQNAYMASPTHRANVLDTWNWVGVGYARSNDVTYTVQVFMKGCT